MSGVLRHQREPERYHFVGEILDVKIDEAVLGDNGKPDIMKVAPIIFSPEAQQYNGVGTYIGQAFDIGRKR